MLNSKKTKISILTLLIGIIGLTIVKITNYTPPCILKEYTNIICPGCGMGRATKAILNLQFYNAWKLDPVKFSILPIIIILGIHAWYQWVHDKSKLNKNKQLVIYILFFIIFINTCIQNCNNF